LKKLIFYFLVTLISLSLINSILIIRDILELQKIKAEPYTPRPKTWVKSEVIQMLAEKAIENNLSPKYVIALANCESSASTTIQSRAIQKYGREQSFGIFQIHTYAHKHITPEMAKDPIFNTNWAIEEIKKGKAPRHWVHCHKVASKVK
jgi:uncharacterized protein YifN (PemK superfamily)